MSSFVRPSKLQLLVAALFVQVINNMSVSADVHHLKRKSRLATEMDDRSIPSIDWYSINIAQSLGFQTVRYASAGFGGTADNPR